MASASTRRDRGEKVTLKYYVRLERESVLGHVTRADVSRSPLAPCYGAGPSVARRSLLLARELSSLLFPFFSLFLGLILFVKCLLFLYYLSFSFLKVVFIFIFYFLNISYHSFLKVFFFKSSFSLFLRICLTISI